MKTIYEVQRLDKSHWGVVEVRHATPWAHIQPSADIVSVHTDRSLAEREKRSLNGEGARRLGEITKNIVRQVRGHHHG